ncbi:hypothetical protein M378DRAFT_163591 [Amanita muscaria Koide BX008]|uniref:Uncharacterized protein n=1 Tax=Amanita muscaria (strain Koide BX008) TaxID=946122 RepID=A0A0C2SLR6_AMAMK|nr:hypothetical protein M378DRAFT_163591 [Amanita muscaria Koide BX008]
MLSNFASGNNHGLMAHDLLADTTRRMVILGGPVLDCISFVLSSTLDLGSWSTLRQSTEPFRRCSHYPPNLIKRIGNVFVLGEDFDRIVLCIII